MIDGGPDGRPAPGAQAVRHIVWDWNGTLLADADLLVRAVNVALVALGGDPVDPEDHRLRYTSPARAYYEGRLGRRLTDDEFEHLCDTLDAAYEAELPRCDLTAGALEGLRSWPGGQSLLSLADHDHVCAEVDRRGLRGYFRRVDGRPVSGRGRKTEHLTAHLRALKLTGADVVLIGDSPEDHSAALAVGAESILYSGGWVHRRRLVETSAPVCDTMPDALALARALG